MFRVDSDPHSILQQISELEFGLPHMGVELDTLVIDDSGYLPYVYRLKLLGVRLADPEVRDLLVCYGYAAKGCSSTLVELLDRFMYCPTAPPRSRSSRTTRSETPGGGTSRIGASATGASAAGRSTGT